MSSIVNNPAPVVNDNPILNRRSMISIGVMLVIWASLLFYALLKVWPRDHPDGRPIYFFSKIPFLQFQLESGSLDQRLIALVVIVGALGSFIHSATSFADYVGNRKFVESWTWWYLLRPFVGSALALALYFVVRAGLLGLRSGWPFLCPWPRGCRQGLDLPRAAYRRHGRVAQQLWRSDSGSDVWSVFQTSDGQTGGSVHNFLQTESGKGRCKARR